MPEIENYAELNRVITEEIGMPILTKWLVLGEGINSDGARTMFQISSDACMHWDELGLMEFRKQWLLQAQREA